MILRSRRVIGWLTGIAFILIVGKGNAQQAAKHIDTIVNVANQSVGFWQKENWGANERLLVGVIILMFIQLIVVAGIAFYITGGLKRKLKRIVARVDELTRETENNNTQRKIEDLREIVQLAMENNPLFLTRFNELDPEFVKRILQIAPNMVAVEIEMCILLRINFDTKEIARFTKSSVRSVEGKKRRIRKKLNIPSVMDINVWMANV